jgi:hypothetical protein
MDGWRNPEIQDARKKVAMRPDDDLKPGLDKGR